VIFISILIPFYSAKGFNSIYLCGKLNSPEANYKVSTGNKMGRVRSKKVSENNVLIKIKIIKYKMTMSTLLLYNSIQFKFICVQKLNSPEANYKVSTV
jgi:hypothetical protein